MLGAPESNPIKLNVSFTIPKQQWVHLVAGGVGGMAGALLTSPLDVVKTRLQSDLYRSNSLAFAQQRRNMLFMGFIHFRDTIRILFNVYHFEGFRALFKGLGPNLVGIVPARAINFYAYGNGKRFISENFNNGRETSTIHLLAAGIAGILTATATNPIWLVKTRLQLDREKSVNRERLYRNSYDCIKKVVRSEGVGGLYRGLSASYLGVTEGALQWVMYERLKRQFRPPSPNNRTTESTFHIWMGKFGAAGIAKFIATIVTYPHEVIRTRLRQATTEVGQRRKYQGLLQGLSLLYREEGVSGLYSGLTPHMIRVIPNAIILFGSYEIILQMYGMTA